MADDVTVEHDFADDNTVDHDLANDIILLMILIPRCDASLQ